MLPPFLIQAQALVVTFSTDLKTQFVHSKMIQINFVIVLCNQHVGASCPESLKQFPSELIKFSDSDSGQH